MALKEPLHTHTLVPTIRGAGKEAEAAVPPARTVLSNVSAQSLSGKICYARSAEPVRGNDLVDDIQISNRTYGSIGQSGEGKGNEGR